MVRWEGFLLALVFPLAWLLRIHSIRNAIKKIVNWQHIFFTWAWILRMFYISGTTFTLFQQDFIFSSVGSPIWNCPYIGVNLYTYKPVKMCFMKHTCDIPLEGITDNIYDFSRPFSALPFSTHPQCIPALSPPTHLYKW